jgi:hypothetical protein
MIVGFFSYHYYISRYSYPTFWFWKGKYHIEVSIEGMGWEYYHSPAHCHPLYGYLLAHQIRSDCGIDYGHSLSISEHSSTRSLHKNMQLYILAFLVGRCIAAMKALGIKFVSSATQNVRMLTGTTHRSSKAPLLDPGSWHVDYKPRGGYHGDKQ